MTKHVALLAAVELAVGNNSLRVQENTTFGGTGLATLSIPAGTYYPRGDGAADDLFFALRTMLQSHGNATLPNTYTVTTTWSSDPASPCAALSVSAVGGSSFSLLWFDALSTLDSKLFGFPDTNTVFNTLAKASTLTPSSLWVSSDVYVELEPEAEWDVSVRKARNGKVRGLRRGDRQQMRRLGLDFIDERRTLTSRITADLSRAFETFLDDWNDGGHFEVHGLVPTSGTTLPTPTPLTRDGTAWHFNEDTARKFTPRRQEPGLAVYAWEVGLLGYVA